MTTSDDADTPLDELRPSSALRRLLECALAESAPSDALVYALCSIARDGSGCKWRERAAACWFLRYAAEGERTVAAEALCDVVVAGEYPRVGHVLRWLTRSAAVLVAMSCAAGSIALRSDGGWAHAFVRFAVDAWPTVFVLMVPVSLLNDAVRAHWCRQQAVESLGVLAVPDTIRVLAQEAIGKKGPVRDAAVEAVVPVLDAITEAHYGVLGAAVMDVCELLRDENASVRVAAVGALGRFGDGRAVDPVNDLTFDDNPPELRAVLAAAIPKLRDRQRQELDKSRLLRPAQAPDDPSQVLLRPAGGVPTQDPSLLLRPADANDAADTK